MWPLAFLPEKKQFWHMSKLKQRKHRYLQVNDSGGVGDVIRMGAEKVVTSSATRTTHHDDTVINVPGHTLPGKKRSLCQSYIIGTLKRVLLCHPDNCFGSKLHDDVESG